MKKYKDWIVAGSLLVCWVFMASYTVAKLAAMVAAWRGGPSA